DSVLDVPARIVTGGDGRLGLRQSQTAISIAPNSDVEIPEDARRGQLIARLIQRKGNVFYDVESRKIEKLRVQTPFLVAVVKGTQFNVAVQANATTISLFRGELEIRTPDGADVVELHAGEIALRMSGEAAIRVVPMNGDRAQVPGDRAQTPAARTAPAGEPGT